MSEWIVCGLQVTLLGLVTWLIGRLVIKRFPELTVTVSLVGLLGGACLVLATAIDAPRAVNFASIFETTPANGDFAATATSSKPVDTAQIEVDSDAKTGVRSLGGIATWLKFGASLINDPAVSASEERQNKQTAWSAAQWMFLGAALVSLLATLRCLLGIGAAFWFRHVSRTVEDQRILAIRDSVAGQMGVSQPVLLRQHARVDSPFVCWLTGWTVFLPTQAENWNDDELSAAIAHELAHLQRYDTWIRFCGELAYTLVAWNPFYWLARRQCLVAQELAADQLVARQLQAGDAYLTGLSRLALRLDGGLGERFLMPGVCFSNHCLIRRIKMLKCFRMESRSAAGWLNRATGTVMVLMIVLTGVWTVSAQEGEIAVGSGVQAAGWQNDELAWERASVEQVDGVVVQASPVAPANGLFNRTRTEPWTVLGSQEGYISIRLADLISHPSLKQSEPAIQAATSQFIPPDENGRPLDISEFGLRVNEIELVELPGRTILSLNPFGFAYAPGNFALHVRSKNEIDWPKIATKFETPIEWILSFSNTRDWDSAEISAKIQQQAIYGKVLQLKMFDSPSKFPKLELTARRKAMWDDVAGGVVTIMVPFRFNPHEAMDNNGEEKVESKEDDAMLGLYKLLGRKVKVLAVGIDFQELSSDETLVVCLEPVEGTSVDELLMLFRNQFKELVQELESDLAEEIRPEICEDMKTYISVLQQVSIERIGEGDLARVRIQSSFPLLQGLVEGFELGAQVKNRE
jgi:beta-lactamase regulating signal transducer with metallopeptidase domain